MSIGIWNYRGSLTVDWNERRIAAGITMDDAMKLGIETAEARKAAQSQGSDNGEKKAA